MFPAWFDILKVNPYELVAVFATLLMPETNGMSDLMYYCPPVTPRGQCNELLAPSHPHR
jgi:hypothetical protein